MVGRSEDIRALSFNAYINKYRKTKTKEILEILDEKFDNSAEILERLFTLNPNGLGLKDFVASSIKNPNMTNLREWGRIVYRDVAEEKAVKNGLSAKDELFNQFLDLEVEFQIYQLFGDVDSARNLLNQQMMICSILPPAPKIVYFWAYEDSCEDCKNLHNSLEPQIDGLEKPAMPHPKCRCESFDYKPSVGQYLKRSSTKQSKFGIIDAFKSFFTSPLEGIHFALDLLGFVPVVGNIADGINAILYVAEGDYLNATLSGLSCIPFAGYISGGIKVVNTGAKVLDKALDSARVVDKVVDAYRVADSIKDATKVIDKAGDVSKLVDGISDTARFVENVGEYGRVADDISSLVKTAEGVQDATKTADDVVKSLKRVDNKVKDASSVLERSKKLRGSIKSSDVVKGIDDAVDTKKVIQSSVSGDFASQVSETFTRNKNFDEAVETLRKSQKFDIYEPEVKISQNLQENGGKIFDEELKFFKNDDIINSNRRSWHQTEIDVGAEYPDFSAQRSFKNRQEVGYATKGSSRPDLYKEGVSIEVKNYNLSTSANRNNLVRNVNRNYEKRLVNLPEGTRQIVVMDVRGQKVANSAIRDVCDKTNKNIVLAMYKG